MLVEAVEPGAGRDFLARTLGLNTPLVCQWYLKANLCEVAGCWLPEDPIAQREGPGRVGACCSEEELDSGS
jgi:hypothetical protein